MLVVSDLHKKYGDVPALAGAGLEVSRGQMLGFLGPNGAGKTTTMRAIFGLVHPDSGSVTWDGAEIAHSDLLGFGYMPEERGLYPKMRAADQLAYFARLHGMGKRDAAEAAASWLDRLGLGDRADSPIEALSHGNQQRVQLAAALVHDPDLLVLDEPFSGLDPIAVETMSEILSEQARLGKAVVFSSHQLDLVEDLCEDVVILNAGVVVVEGRVADLKDSAPIRHLELDVEGDARALIEDLEGVHELRAMDGRVVATIDSTTDIRGFIGRAQEAGRLRHFTYTTPTLSDLFREAVR